MYNCTTDCHVLVLGDAIVAWFSPIGTSSYSIYRAFAILYPEYSALWGGHSITAFINVIKSVNEVAIDGCLTVPRGSAHSNPTRGKSGTPYFKKTTQYLCYFAHEPDPAGNVGLERFFLKLKHFALSVTISKRFPNVT